VRAAGVATARRSRVLIAALLLSVLLACAPLALVTSGTVTLKSRAFRWDRFAVGVMYINAICPGKDRELCQWLGLYYELYEADGKMIAAKQMLAIPISRAR
jgi:hypothetical protein